MTWADIVAIAGKRGAAVDKDRISIDGEIVVRLVEPGIVAFALGDGEQIAAPFFTNDRFRDLSVGLARLSDLSPEVVRARFGVAKVVEPAVRTAHCYWLALWSASGSDREKRRFFRYSAPSLLGWFAEGWKLAAKGEDWPPKLRAEERDDLQRMFMRVFEDGEPRPRTPEQLLAAIRASLDGDAEEHFIHGELDDDEGTDVEYFMFDDAFLATPDVLDRLPNPKRARKRDADDGYPALIEKLTNR